MWRTCAGSFGRPRTGCGARYGLSVSARMRSDGHSRRGGAQVLGLRVGHVARRTRRSSRARAPARAGPAPRSSGGSPCPPNGAERRGRLLAGLAAVDDDGLAELVGEGELRVEERRAARTAVASAVVAVEPRLADGDRARMPEQLAQLVDPRRVRRRRLVRIDPERSEDACVRAPQSRARRGTSRCRCRS